MVEVEAIDCKMFELVTEHFDRVARLGLGDRGPAGEVADVGWSVSGKEATNELNLGRVDINNLRGDEIVDEAVSMDQSLQRP